MANYLVMRTVGVCAAALGVLLLAVGLFLGMSSVSANGNPCGSAFSPNNDAAEVQALTDSFNGPSVTDTASCADATSGRKTAAIAMIVPGVLLLIGGAIGTLAGATGERNRRSDALIAAERKAQG